MASLIEQLSAKTLVLTVTPGRSGTKLLANLLSASLGISAEHEPSPRVNYVLRSLISAPEAATGWLMTEKLPAVLAVARGPVYAETSHLFCKGLIEPILGLGLRPKFVILTRPATEVACSLFRMDVVPERTGAGRLVLLGPRDPGVWRLPGWGKMSDYQLCYWYAREIERRQAHYTALFARSRIEAFRIAMLSLSDWNSFRHLARFVAGSDREPDEDRHQTIVRVNQNTRTAATGRLVDRPLPENIREQEMEVEAALGACYDLDPVETETNGSGNRSRSAGSSR